MKRYKDIVPDYEEYRRLQQGNYCSFESSNAHWAAGQQRYIQTQFQTLNRDAALLDIACGDGVGLREFHALGFSNVTGVEFNKVKAELARRIGYPVHELDMHALEMFPENTFDVVYSSHTLEHAYDPDKAVAELRRVLRYTMYLVLPYPDMDDFNIRAHGAKGEIGTNVPDDGETVTKFFTDRGFRLIERRFDQFREPEIWLTLEKVPLVESLSR